MGAMDSSLLDFGGDSKPKCQEVPNQHNYNLHQDEDEMDELRTERERRVWLGAYETTEEATGLMCGLKAWTNFPYDPSCSSSMALALSPALMAKLEKCYLESPRESRRNKAAPTGVKCMDDDDEGKCIEMIEELRYDVFRPEYAEGGEIRWAERDCTAQRRAQLRKMPHQVLRGVMESNLSMSLFLSVGFVVKMTNRTPPRRGGHLPLPHCPSQLRHTIPPLHRCIHVGQPDVPPKMRRLQLDHPPPRPLPPLEMAVYPASVQQSSPYHPVRFHWHGLNQPLGLCSVTGPAQQIHDASVVLDRGAYAVCRNHALEMSPPFVDQASMITSGQDSDEGDSVRRHVLL
ncbi:hypothetical protein MUK42_24824 [Musa troglodytarum]|uniref:AP2/ERF domain-containing protein n=1 Tax=Musa troglodytarum TaxID=320322 RepID=A0A9E7JN54_9LILI|nr:hypothetical protein MUK42_24824 [Musa troglodytarum]